MNVHNLPNGIRPADPTEPEGTRSPTLLRAAGAADPRFAHIRHGINQTLWHVVDTGRDAEFTSIDFASLSTGELVLLAARCLRELELEQIDEVLG